MENPFIFQQSVYEDSRGVFSPLPLAFTTTSDVRLQKKWIQSNISVNPKKGTFRGMHFQEPFAQSKLVKVINGEIIDFLLDLRKESPTYGEVSKWLINRDSALYVPKGFAHGFLTLIDDTVVQYLVDEVWVKDCEHIINPYSIDLVNVEINTHFIPSELIISEKDLKGKHFNHYFKLW